MEEEPCKSVHREIDTNMAIEKLGYDAFMRRNIRFHESMQEAQKGNPEFADPILYANQELVDLYDRAEVLGLEAIEACIQWKEALRDIAAKRREIELNRIEKENMRRTLGSDALNVVEADAPPQDSGLLE